MTDLMTKAEPSNSILADLTEAEFKRALRIIEEVEQLSFDSHELINFDNGCDCEEPSINRVIFDSYVSTSYTYGGCRVCSQQIKIDITFANKADQITNKLAEKRELETVHRIADIEAQEKLELIRLLAKHGQP